MKILVPTDFSANAKHAFEFAKKIARFSKSSLTLIYSYYNAYDFAAQASGILRQIESSAKRAMEEELKSGAPHKLQVDFKIRQGTISTAVTYAAYQEDYDLIIMGTQGASGIEKKLMGSNTVHVIRESRVPVLAVPFEADVEMIHEIVVAVGWHKGEKLLFDHMMRLTQAWGWPYHLIHIQTGDVEENAFSFTDWQIKLKEDFPDTLFKFTEIPAKEIIRGINQYLDKSPGALLVMFSKNRTFFEFLFSKGDAITMAYHIHVPLLVLKS